MKWFCSLLVSALAVAPALAEPVVSSGAWTVYRAELGFSASTQLAGGEKFGLLCLRHRAECIYFVKPMLPCEDGHRVPVRLEGSAGIWRLKGLCTPIESGYLLLFDEDLGELVRGSPGVDAWVRGPGGRGKTMHFDMSGGTETTRQVRDEHQQYRRESGVDSPSVRI